MIHRKKLFNLLIIILKLIVCINMLFNIVVLTDIFININEYTVLYLFEQLDQYSILNDKDKVLIAQFSLIIHIVCDIVILLCITNRIQRRKLKLFFSIIVLFLFFFVNIKNHNLLFDSIDVLENYKTYLVEINTSNIDTEIIKTEVHEKKSNNMKTIIITIMVVSYIALWVSVNGNVYWHSLQNVFTINGNDNNTSKIVLGKMESNTDNVYEGLVEKENSELEERRIEKIETASEEKKKISSEEKVNTSPVEEVNTSSGEEEKVIVSAIDLQIKETYNKLEDYIKTTKLDVFQRNELKEKIGKIYMNMKESQKKELLEMLNKVENETLQIKRINDWKEETNIALGRSSGTEYNNILHKQILKLQETVSMINERHLEDGILKNIMRDQLLTRVNKIITSQNEVMEKMFYKSDISHYVKTMDITMENNIKTAILVQLDSEEISKYIYGSIDGNLWDKQNSVCRALLGVLNDFM